MTAMMSAACSTPSAAAEGTSTTRAMLQLSAKAADAKVRRDLLSVLQPTERFERGNRIRVSGMALDTAPYGAGFKGLCRKDELSLTYESKVHGANGVDDPLTPVGIDAQPLFHVLGGPVADFPDGFARSVAWNDADCSKLRSDKLASWFSAANSREAAKGLNVLLAALDNLRSRSLKAKVCDIKTESASCEDAILKVAGADKVSSVDKDCSAPPSQECFRIVLLPGTELVIFASFDSDQPLTPSKIESLTAAAYIVVT